MKLIHIISSVAIFCLPALAVNDWDCEQAYISADALEALMNSVARNREERERGSFFGASSEHYFTVLRNGDDLDYARAKFEISFNNEFKVGQLLMNIDDVITRCVDTNTRR
ncbi:CSEP0110 putative effector protein [Blumeria hordei DH14]|uniref:CSEP0110 putative effector protein n=1 Tax=Blumeria graminis f. sp. hordei (strain DH14) TaxID=546991 RepID=N1JBI3_BLUG1|nr:CSEP0110 putative effector protein [Blumeria hordei DH14]